MDTRAQHFLQSENNVEVGIPNAGDILRANAIGRWTPTSGEIDGSLDIPTVLTLQLGFITMRYSAGVLIIYVNDDGVIKQLTLGEPG